jgi:sirohydrochlorin cobaltochelatase
MKKRVGVVLIAHGSKRSESNEEFMQLCEEIRLENILDFDEINCAFLEFQTPSLEIAIERMHNKNIDEVYIYPYFLNSGKHVLVDLPEIISQMQEKHTEMKIQLLTHFGASPSITAIIANDLKSIFFA